MCGLYADLSGPGVYAAHLVSRIMLISTSAPCPVLMATSYLDSSHVDVFDQFSFWDILILVHQFAFACERSKCTLFAQRLSFYGFCMRDYSR